jgi:heptose I phosphotransferase
VHDRVYFAKIHFGIGWYALFKDLLQFKLPVLGARHEWMALNRLHQIGVETLRPVAYGIRGWNPARIRSFLITEALIDTRTLEDVCREWIAHPPSIQLKKTLIVRVAWMVRQMHIHGMNHRDCYICHFHVDVSALQENGNPEDQHVYVIDLHRAQIRRRTPRRWLIKDLAGLYFSAMDIGLTRSDIFRFIKAYEQKPLRKIFSKDPRFWRHVETKALALYKRLFGSIPENACDFTRPTT